MPMFGYRRKFNRRRFTRKRYGRKPKMGHGLTISYGRGRPPRATMIRRTKLVFPPSKTFKFHLTCQTSVSTVAGAFSLLDNPIKLNFPGDPLGAGGTAKPRYYDSVFGADDATGVYKYGYCYGAKVRILACNAGQIGDVGFCAYSSETTAPASIQEIGERPWSGHALIEPYTGGGKTVAKFSKYFNFGAITSKGSTKSYLEDTNYRFTYNSSPTKYVYLQLASDPYPGNNDSVTFVLDITFYVKATVLADVATNA